MLFREENLQVIDISSVREKCVYVEFQGISNAYISCSGAEADINLICSTVDAVSGECFIFHTEIPSICSFNLYWTWNPVKTENTTIEKKPKSL